MGKKNILRSGFFNADRVTLLTVTAVFAVMAVLVYTGNVGRQIQNMLRRRWWGLSSGCPRCGWAATISPS